MDFIVFFYCFTIEGYNVFVTKIFPSCYYMEDPLSMGPSNNNLGDVDTLLNL